MNHVVTHSVLDPACFGCCRGATRARTLDQCLVDEMGALVDVVDYDPGAAFVALVSFLWTPIARLRSPTWADSFWVELESVGSRETCSWWCARQRSSIVGVDVDVDADVDLDLGLGLGLGGCGCGCGGWWQTSLGLSLDDPSTDQSMYWREC